MSQPKRFTAANLRDAYQKVRDEMGGDAIIISTRKVLAPGVVGEPAQELVEVRARLSDASDGSLEASAAMHDLLRETVEEAATGMSLDPAVELAPAFLNKHAGKGLRNSPFAALTTSEPAATSADAPKVPERVTERTNAPALNALPGVRTPSPVAALAPQTPMPREAMPAVDGDPVAGLSQRVDQIRALVESMAMERMDERSTQSPALRAAYERLDEQDMTRAVAASVLGRVETMIGRNISREAGLRALNRALAALLPAATMPAPGEETRAVVLVGPSGAGKTTLAMRMALDLRRRGLRVMVASTDVSRVGAPQQLDAMGAALEVPVSLCYAPADVSALLSDGTLDVVIVDTPGHMGGRRDRLAELSAMLRSLPHRDVLLVLPATMRATDQRDVVTAFQPHGLSGLAFTRCDETVRFGAAASASIEAGLGVMFTTHSDLVTDTPRVGDTRALAAAVATGRWVDGGSTTPVGRTLARAS